VTHQALSTFCPSFSRPPRNAVLTGLCLQGSSPARGTLLLPCSSVRKEDPAAWLTQECWLLAGRHLCQINIKHNSNGHCQRQSRRRLCDWQTACIAESNQCRNILDSTCSAQLLPTLGALVTRSVGVIQGGCQGRHRRRHLHGVHILRSGLCPQIPYSRTSISGAPRPGTSTAAPAARRKQGSPWSLISRGLSQLDIHSQSLKQGEAG